MCEWKDAPEPPIGWRAFPVEGDSIEHQIKQGDLDRIHKAWRGCPCNRRISCLWCEGKGWEKHAVSLQPEFCAFCRGTGRLSLAANGPVDTDSMTEAAQILCKMGKDAG